MLLVDASFGFEMETFEFLNILQVRFALLVLVVFPVLEKCSSLILISIDARIPEGHGYPHPSRRVQVGEEGSPGQEEAQATLLDRNLSGSDWMSVLSDVKFSSCLLHLGCEVVLLLGRPARSISKDGSHELESIHFRHEVPTSRLAKHPPLRSCRSVCG